MSEHWLRQQRVVQASVQVPSGGRASAGEPSGAGERADGLGVTARGSAVS